MRQRWTALGIASGLLVALFLAVGAAPLPYAVHSPGPTFDILAEDSDNAELIQIDGSEVDVHHDDGELRFTTVRSTARDHRPNLMELLQAWVDSDRAVLPFDVAHPPGQTLEEDLQEGQASMASSQDIAAAVALNELGYDVPTSIEVHLVLEDGAAHGKLLTGDVFLRADGERVETPQDVVAAVEAHEPGDPVSFRIRRGGERLNVEIAPEEVKGEPRIGVSVGPGYDLPFDVKIRVDEAIGGPSAGLMFSLAIYDTLTPGSLSGGAVVAGTGEIATDGAVGPIGGIAQKIAAAEDADAELFFVPSANCPDVSGLDPDLRLVKAETMHDARLALEAWTEDPDSDLPAC